GGIVRGGRSISDDGRRRTGGRPRSEEGRGMKESASALALAKSGLGAGSTEGARHPLGVTLETSPPRALGIELLILPRGPAAFSRGVPPARGGAGRRRAWDPSVHLGDSWVYERVLRHPSAVSGGVLTAILHGSEDSPLLPPSGYSPPLVPGLTALVYLV